MIVSASYRTDIPAFYGAWFQNRLDAGFCRVVNPWGGPPFTVPLDGEAVEGFVFWTRNAKPFLPVLAEVARRRYPFVVQYTLTGYPRALERGVPALAHGLEVMARLAGEYGSDALVWRYDPVLETSATPRDFHLANFARLARALEGVTDEVVVSFAHLYRKTRRNLEAATRAAGLAWRDPDGEWKREVAAALAAAAAAHGMRLGLCAQPAYLAGGAGGARCIDAGRLGRLAGRSIEAPEKGNRPGCLCHQSRDVGAYESCPHGCVYCYAVADSARAAARAKRHDPGAEFLFAPKRGALAAAEDRLAAP